MKIVIAVDSFKGSMSSLEAGLAVKNGIKRLKKKDIEIIVKPIADGGEGTTDALIEGMGGEYINVRVTGPLGEKTNAKYGIIEKNIAIIEVAQAAGITLIDREKLDPLNATTYGVGEMIIDAVNRGCREFIVGIGGSATVDGGVGMLMALGYKFYDSKGKTIGRGIKDLDKIEIISDIDVKNEIKECSFRVACDVKNPILGENGAIYIYGPQKGVKECEKELFEKKIAHYVKKTTEYKKVDIRNIEGTGAAGGLGFAFLSCLKANLESGIEIVLDTLKIEEELKDADIVVTGEGKLDRQTAMGKVPIGIAKLAKKYDTIVVAFAGSVTRDAILCNQEGIDAFFPIVRGVTSLDEAMDIENAKKNMEDSVEQVFNLLI